ncbi:hypothetical protein CsatA_014108 [Cannabis sativa]
MEASPLVALLQEMPVCIDELHSIDSLEFNGRSEGLITNHLKRIEKTSLIKGQVLPGCSMTKPQRERVHTVKISIHSWVDLTCNFLSATTHQ